MRKTVVLGASALCIPAFLYAQPTGTPNDIVSLAGGPGDQHFYAVKELSDGSVLVGGAADSMNWVPSGVTVTEISVDPNELINDNTTTGYAFLLHLSGNLRNVLRVVHFPEGAAVDVRYIKTDTAPGTTTGNLYISGMNDAIASRDDGYYVAKLNNNFVNAAPTAVDWAFTVWAEGDHKEFQPWDVDSQGRVVYVRGEPNDFNWCSMHRWDPTIQRDGIVPNWRRHWIGPDPDNITSEFAGIAADAPGTVQHSGIVLKPVNRGDLRSWSEADYNGWFPDGNGGWRKGRYPADLFYAEPWDINDPSGSQSLGGYTGYRLPDSGSTTARVGAIVVDKRNDHFYVGYNFKSVLPGGNPDFEPTVMAFTDTGEMKWWNRLWREYTGEPGSGTPNTSSPDQYVDGLAIDYSQPPGSTALVVLARSHGNNTVNFWPGNQIVHPDNPGTSFHNGFTGTNGNIHISWIGRFADADGTVLHASWNAEYNNTTSGLGSSYADPNLDGWPSHNAGWPNLNTTRMRPTMHVDLEGRIYVIGKSARRTITTTNAFQKMVPFGEGDSKWNHYVRVYTPDMTTLVYSSLLTGDWDPAAGAGDPNNVEIHGIHPSTNGLLAVGFHTTEGNTIPTRNELPWGVASRDGETPVIAKLFFDESTTTVDFWHLF